MHAKLAVIGRNEKIDASYCIFWGEKNFAQRFSHQGRRRIRLLFMAGM